MFFNLKVYSACKNNSLEYLYGSNSLKLGVPLILIILNTLKSCYAKITIKTKGKKKLKCIQWLGIYCTFPIKLYSFGYSFFDLNVHF